MTAICDAASPMSDAVGRLMLQLYKYKIITVKTNYINDKILQLTHLPKNVQKTSAERKLTATRPYWSELRQNYLEILRWKLLHAGNEEQAPQKAAPRAPGSQNESETR